MEKIVSVAHRVKVPEAMRAEMWNGEHVYPEYMIVAVPRPGRHHTVMHPLHELGINVHGMNDQGFLTSKGRWVDRTEGCLIARRASQIRKKHGPDDMLFSEDMW